MFSVCSLMRGLGVLTPGDGVLSVLPWLPLNTRGEAVPDSGNDGLDCELYTPGLQYITQQLKL